MDAALYYATVIVGGLIVAAVILIAFCGWVGPISTWRRTGLTAIAGGLLMGAPDWIGGARPSGLAALVILTGILISGLAGYGQALMDHLDGIDGEEDGIVNFLQRRDRQALTDAIPSLMSGRIAQPGEKAPKD